MAVILIYLLEMSALDPFQTGILRRIICVLYVLPAVLQRRNVFSVRYPHLIIAFVFIGQCFQDPQATVSGLVRSVSLFCYWGAVRAMLESSGSVCEAYRKYARIWTAAVFCLVCIGWNMFSSNDDWTGIWANRNMTVSLMMSSAVLGDAFRQKSIRILLRVFFLAAAFRTGSRMAAVMTMVWLIVFLIGRDGRKYLPVVVMLCFGWLIFLRLYVPLPESFLRLFQDQTASSGWLRDTWKIGIRLFAERPFLGHGTHTAWYYTFAANSGGWGWGMHNSWLTVLSENGVLGCTLLLVLLWEHCRKCAALIRNPQVPPEEKEVLKDAVLLTVLLGVNACSESFLFSAGNVMSLPFWLSYFLIDLYYGEER